uniref:Uncharacterized protein n=1 Tax=Moschus moschiferus TaxID=68415 RepID=A0A8C6FJ63_MOSMO
MALAAVKWAVSSRTILKHLFPIQNGSPQLSFSFLHFLSFFLILWPPHVTS